MDQPISQRSYQACVLRNEKGKRYIGLSADVARRLRQHNEGVCRWTRSRGPWRLEW
ncbi:MAG: GIY-YIG nuclease family protein, partial [Verrucomicrobia bacterium]|nr:GIY-YIG nuclease family protein [Verrucomicrobiota bacterium]